MIVESIKGRNCQVLFKRARNVMVINCKKYIIIKIILFVTILTGIMLLFPVQSKAATKTTIIYMTVREKEKLPKQSRSITSEYTTSKPKTLSISNKGTMYAKKMGSAVVTSVYTDKKGKRIKIKYKIKIHEKVKCLAWTEEKSKMFVGDEYKMSIAYKVKSKKNVSFVWESSAPNIATVDQKGNIKALENGKTIISCSVKGQKKAKISTELNVKNKPEQTFDLDDNSSTNKLFEISNLHNGDAKFMGKNIITSVKSKLTLIDLNGNIIKTFESVNSSWVDAIDDEKIIIYGNSDKQIGIVMLDDNYNMVSNNIIFESDNLLIDPTISRINERYYATVTEIKGAVNNSNPDVANGEYWIHLYVSDDLITWSQISDIEHMNNNLEDVDFIEMDGNLYAIYEKEELDKGNSAILMKSSGDYGSHGQIQRFLLKQIVIMNRLAYIGI